MSVKYDLYYSKEHEYNYGSSSYTLPNGETLTYTEMIRTGESPTTFRYEDLEFVATIDPKKCKFAPKEKGHMYLPELPYPRVNLITMAWGGVKMPYKD